jgi:hypothetical protein
LAWYVKHYPGLFSSANYFFDPNEPFRHSFETLLRKKKMELLDVTGSRETWLMIKSVATVEGSEAPAMQLADLLAWGTNRYLCAQEGDFMKHLAPSSSKLSQIVRFTSTTRT